MSDLVAEDGVSETSAQPRRRNYDGETELLADRLTTTLYVKRTGPGRRPHKPGPRKQVDVSGALIITTPGLNA